MSPGLLFGSLNLFLDHHWPLASLVHPSPSDSFHPHLPSRALTILCLSLCHWSVPYTLCPRPIRWKMDNCILKQSLTLQSFYSACQPGLSPKEEPLPTSKEQRPFIHTQLKSPRLYPLPQAPCPFPVLSLLNFLIAWSQDGYKLYLE